MKMKKFASVLLSGLMAASAVPFNAATLPYSSFIASAAENSAAAEIASGKCGENASFFLDSEGTLTISGTGYMKQPKELYMPEEENLFLQTPKYSVKKIVIEEGITEIGMQAFNKLSEVTSLTLPESLEAINLNAFEGCASLKSVKIPDSVTSLGWCSFANCTSLEEVILPNNDEYTCISVFANCDNLNSISLGDKTTHIPEYLFAQCSGLKEITIPDGIKDIGIAAFSECINLENVIIPDSVKIIAPVAFSDCTSLKTITIPENVSTIGKGAFLDCPALTEINVDSENSYFTSADGVLFNKDKTALVQYPEGKGNGYIIPESVTEINEMAFSDCDDLSSITLHKNINKIGSSAFEECNNLTSIIFCNPECKIFDDAYTIPENTIIYGYAGSTAQEYAEKYEREFVVLDEKAPELKPTLLGDANCDEIVSLADAAAIFQSIGNYDKYALSEQGAVNADIYEPGSGITPLDAITIMQIEAGIL
ncbi:MAG: leucine-rich repeat domain-containing protein [Ruminococcus sp.]|nr:leucine-rich repeat domain-containing protein [Ruminococcus sp.]